MSTVSDAYARAGVDPSKINQFKRIIAAMGKRTLAFPRRHGVEIDQCDHAAGFSFPDGWPYKIMETEEGLGNKNWIAQWMYQHAGTGLTYHDGIGLENLLMAANDVAAHGARPFMYLDTAAAGDSTWFTDKKRSHDLAESYFRICQDLNIAIPAGESPSLRYLVKAELPVTSAPVLGGCVTGFVATKEQFITGKKVGPGTRIIGVTSSGLHSNGISLAIDEAMKLPDKFLTPLNGHTFGEEALIPTRSYVQLVAALLDEGIEILGFLPSTGDGVAKLATADKRSFTWRIHTWIKEIPPLFHFLFNLGISLKDCLNSLNWGIGYYVFVRPEHVDQVIAVGTRAGYELHEVGVVEDGPRQTIFGPANNLVLPPRDLDLAA